MTKAEEYVNFAHNLSESLVPKDTRIMAAFLELFIQSCDFVFPPTVMWIIRRGRSNKEI